MLACFTLYIVNNNYVSWILTVVSALPVVDTAEASFHSNADGVVLVSQLLPLAVVEVVRLEAAHHASEVLKTAADRCNIYRHDRTKNQKLLITSKVNHKRTNP